MRPSRAWSRSSRFLWNLHRDMRAMDRRIGDLAERIARLEGSVEVLTRFFIDRERHAAGE